MYGGIMDYGKIALAWAFAIIAMILAITVANLVGCSGGIPIPDKLVKTVYEECEGHGKRCNGSVAEQCTGHQWYPQFDCAAMTVNGEPHPLRCVDGGCV